MKTKKIVNILSIVLILCLSTILFPISANAAPSLVRVNGTLVPVGTTVINFYKTGPYSGNLSAVDYTLNYTAEGLQLRSFDAPNLPGYLYNNLENQGKIRLIASNGVQGFNFTTKKYLAIAKFKVKYTTKSVAISNTVNGFYDMNSNLLTPTGKAITWGILGDLDNSYGISIADATIIQKYIAKMVTLTDDQLILADANCDGVVDMSDVIHIQKYLAGLISEL